MIKINYEGKLFVPELNTENGEVDDHTLFEYHQEGRILYADYLWRRRHKRASYRNSF